MRIYSLAIYCALITTIVCSTIPDTISEDEDDSLTLEAGIPNCSCENGKCVTDKQGHLKCVCPPGFSLQDEFTCMPCDCGPHGKCIFTLKLSNCQNSCNQYRYEKKCLCDVGAAEKDGVCVDCFCGDNSVCNFDSGERRCFCMEGYSEKNGVCTKCDCGSNAESCEFVNGFKRCKCLDGYADRYGTCEQCNCGIRSVSCDFDENKKTCRCLEGYVQKGETCQSGCGSERTCQNGGYCKDGFCFCLKGTRGEFCEIIEDCDCLCPRENGVKCAYDSVNQRPYCACQDSSLGYDPYRKTCRRTCQNDNCCQNQGRCVESSGSKFCNCLEGTNGDFCQDVSVCAGVNCGNDASCVYVPTTKSPGCKCKDPTMYFESRLNRCRHICRQQSDCLNGGKCIKGGFCYCLPGTRGDRCENINDCQSGRLKCLGDGAYCSYEIGKQQASCKCKCINAYYNYNYQKCMMKGPACP